MSTATVQQIPNTPQNTLKQKYINKTLKVVTKNGRTFQGKLVSIDFRSNLILHQTIAQIPPELNCQLNYRLENSLDFKLKAFLDTQHPQFTEEQQKQWIGSHYYFGAVMISGQDIEKVYLKPQTNPKA